MRRIATLFEVISSATLFVLGIYMLQAGVSNKSAGEAVILIGGAVCFTLGMITLVFAVRSILWHQRMLRHSMPHRYLHSATPGHIRGR
jgi:cytochrome c oxidase assembly factor CtaG